MKRKIRLGLPSKGRLAAVAREFLTACDLRVTQTNPRLYTAQINTIPQLEIWLQRPTDIVRQVRDGVLDLGIAGYDLVCEYGGLHDETVVIHDKLGIQPCSLEIIIPQTWTEINTLTDLIAFAHSRPAEQPLRVVSSFERLTTRFLDDHGITPYRYLWAEGAVEASPQMGTADFIIDIVQTGLTLRENNLKVLAGGRIIKSEGCFFGNRAALKVQPELQAITRQMLEMFEAHLRAEQHYNLIANMRGESPQAVANRLHQFPDLAGLQGPTIAPVYPPHGLPEGGEPGWYAISLVVPKKELQRAVQQLREIGGSGVVVLPALFIFEETPERWQALQQTLELAS
jgi:ATP phosphoribosyltransferase